MAALLASWRRSKAGPLVESTGGAAGVGPQRVRTDVMLWTCAALLLAMLPHLFRLPIWLSLFAVSALLWRAAAAVRRSKPLPTWLRLVLTAAAIVAVFSSFHSLIGRGAGSALLCVMTGLKLLETYRRRDVFVCLCLGYFIITIQFLFSQSLLVTAWALLAGLAVTCALLTAEDRTALRSSPVRMRQAAVLLLQAVPIALVLFLLFPRLSSPIWGLPNDGEARTGLSKTMSPGSISQLFIDDSPAFRVSFDGRRPTSSESYWRGLIMWNYDGFTWERSWSFSRVPVEFGQLPAADFRYTVTMEPTDQPWLYTLDTPIETPQDSFLSADLQLYQSDLVTQVYSYQAASVANYTVQPSFAMNSRSAGLQLPEGFNPRTLALGREWKERFATQREIVQHALSWINSEPYYYTLTPPLLGRDAMDDFLFNTREGYCEHYASAFVILMRAAGIPARIVTGYQGGYFNDIGNYLVIRQSDAHAWTEVWLDQGWVRVDPTSAIHPGRVLGGLSGALPASRPGVAPGFLGQFAKTWDAVQNFWNEAFLKFRTGDADQALVALGLGKLNQRQLVIMMTLVVAVLLGATAALFISRKPVRKVDPARGHWDRYVRRLVKAGVPVSANLGPRAISAQAARFLPQHRDRIERLGALYLLVRYGNPENRPPVAVLAREVAGFKVTN